VAIGRTAAENSGAASAAAATGIHLFEFDPYGCVRESGGVGGGGGSGDAVATGLVFDHCALMYIVLCCCNDVLYCLYHRWTV